MEVRENNIKNSNYLFFLKNTRNFLSAVPIVGNVLRLFKRFIEYIIWKSKTVYRGFGHPHQGCRTIWVNPKCIKYCTIKEFNPIMCDGLAIDGDWDLGSKMFCDLDVFHAFEGHFIHGVPWSETEFYLNTVKAIEKGFSYWNCHNREDFIKRCEMLDMLYNDIKINGYKSQREIRKGFLGVLAIDEISVNVDRNGNLLFNNGAHRLSIAKIIGVETVPVRLTVWHRRCREPSFKYDI